jgi:hypothetical protein
MFWTATDLEVKLNAFKDFYNKHGTHAALKGTTPVETPEPKGLSFKSYGGGRTVAGYIKRQLPLERKLAMHTHH